jgi:S-methylmethionine-dependent homocysteine/selenocysteine methylase
MCEGGTETEFMYKHGFELPHFATFPLLENPKAASVMRDMYRSYLDVTASHGMSAIMGGLDYRASPDWGALLGYSPEGLAEANLKALDFLRNIAKEYVGQLPEILINGMIGPRGDAYEANRTITENEAEDYHSVQLNTLKEAEVDLVLAMTFNNVPESIGVARAAAKVGLPLAISLSLDSSSRLNTGPSLADAITTIDRSTNGSPDFYMVNCVHPIEYEPALESGDWIKRVRGIRPNASKMDKMREILRGDILTWIYGVAVVEPGKFIWMKLQKMCLLFVVLHHKNLPRAPGQTNHAESAVRLSR